jgi:hypothetical protein
MVDPRGDLSGTKLVAMVEEIVELQVLVTTISRLHGPFKVLITTIVAKLVRH